MANTNLLLALIKDYKEAQSEELLNTIAELVDSDYETLSPIMESHGVTY